MTTKLFAVVFLALALAACDSSSTPESTNANRTADHPAATASPNTGANEQATPAASTPSPSQFKAGDKVKVKSNGSSSDATVVSVDETLGKVTVKFSGGEEKTVALSDVTKQ